MSNQQLTIPMAAPVSPAMQHVIDFLTRLERQHQLNLWIANQISVLNSQSLEPQALLNGLTSIIRTVFHHQHDQAGRGLIGRDEVLHNAAQWGLSPGRRDALLDRARMVWETRGREVMNLRHAKARAKRLLVAQSVMRVLDGNQEDWGR
ncbi:hypothetical protein EDC01DRAFT_634593 [Geopyxis carbonaria]|nr:hypothetical protein EDC01DRAFT_634593 [Geopyxis carbonaria]